MNKKEIFHFIDNYKWRILPVILIVILSVILGIGAKISSRKADPLYGAREEYKEVTEDESINSLIAQYYDCRSNNKIAELEKIAYPISDMEKSYIAEMSKHIEGYEITKIYTKPGTDSKSFLVSVSVNVKFYDVKNTPPGLDFFYITKDHKGNYYIDNRYCNFNQAYAEIELDENINALKDEFEKQEDLVMLRLSVQNDYNALIDKDSELRGFVNDTLPTAVEKWYSDYITAIEEEKAAEEAAIAEAEAAKKAEEEAKAAAEAEAAAAAAAAAQAQAQAEAAAQAAAAAAAAGIPEGGYSAGTVVTASDILNIRRDPDANSTKIGTVIRGDSVTVVENSGANGWTRVDHRGKVGYIRTDVLR